MPDLPRVLFVDDEPDLLAAIKVNLRKQYRVTVLESAAEALEFLGPAGADTPVDAVVSDMRMPKMNGAEFLTEVRARHPHLPRLLLSGQSDLDAAIAAINEARIFRFLTKPCPNDVLIESIDEAIEQAQLRQVNAELLDQTLSGTVGMLTDVLGLVSAGAYGRTMRLSEIIAAVCAKLGREVPWDLNLATMLSQIGFVVVPDDEDGDTGRLEDRHAELGQMLLAKIPRLESVATMVGHQLNPVGHPPDLPMEAWADDELNIEILRSAVAYDTLLADGVHRDLVVKTLKESPESPPAFVIDALRTYQPDRRAMIELQLPVEDLGTGMELTADVTLTTGSKLAGAGTRLTSPVVERIKAFARTSGVNEPIHVLVPAAEVSRVKS
ncbi:MAG: response regulator [Actinomycetota bacterium]